MHQSLLKAINLQDVLKYEFPVEKWVCLHKITQRGSNTGGCKYEKWHLWVCYKHVSYDCLIGVGLLMIMPICFFTFCPFHLWTEWTYWYSDWLTHSMFVFHDFKHLHHVCGASMYILPCPLQCFLPLNVCIRVAWVNWFLSRWDVLLGWMKCVMWCSHYLSGPCRAVGWLRVCMCDCVQTSQVRSSRL